MPPAPTVSLDEFERRDHGYTLRAVASGVVIGSALSLCNIYLGLKIGWGMNMSITGALVGYGFWRAWNTAAKGRPFGILENNLNQTAASAAAAISSAGLVAPIPALTMLTGRQLGYGELVIWVLSVGLVGVLAGTLVRVRLVESDLAFPGGVATGHTLKEMYAKGSEAMARVRMLLTGGVLGALSKGMNVFWAPPHLVAPVTLGAGGKLAGGYSLANLTLSLEPSLLMVATGGIIGIRATLSMLLGGLFAWLYLAPMAIESGWADAGPLDPRKPWFTQLSKWLLWPGVAMMVTASLTSFAWSSRSMFTGWTGGAPVAEDPRDVPRRTLWAVAAVVIGVSSVLQVMLFDVKPWLSVLGVVLSFGLAVVAGRVSGETGVTPVGAMGKVTQLAFGVLDPANVASNLMAANVTGGAASQCGDLLHDLKTGQMLGSWPRHQAVAQSWGVVGGAVVGSAGYLVLVPDPKNMLMTEQWAAPSVATWKAVAEVFQKGIDAMPTMATEALVLGAAFGVVVTVVEKLAPKRVSAWIPSPVSVGLAFTLQLYTVVSFVIGASLMALGHRFAPGWTQRFGIVLCAGVIAGESIAGVIDAFHKMFGG